MIQQQVNQSTIDINTSTISEIVKEDYSKAEIFNRFGIDFCCGGHRTIAEACQQKDINASEVKEQLRSFTETTPGALNRFNQWDIDFLVAYIVQNHHRFVRQIASELPPLVHKVAEKHGENHPETRQVAQIFEELTTELSAHLQKEEQVLFPYVNELVAAQNKEQSVGEFHCGNIEQPINVMEMEHDNAGNYLKKLNHLTNGYTPPEDACNTFKYVYHKLHELETDLHQHIHLENNIVFPKAKKLEKEMVE
ncbi:MAG: iron-sulfur cluster repair di-iron protein [Caldithrix sp.]|nr:iron-sulfur cluster repair di-iron protein [Caldithrix sp.]